jgi:16S rRNA (cytosine967-C5)-methyltransferase
MPRFSPSRLIAAHVLHRIETEGAWASKALDVEIDSARADERDAALATTIVYGALRALPKLDALIQDQLTKRGSLDPFTQAVLRGAAYQLLHLRTPSHAVVSDSVSIVRLVRGEGLSRFANAVLRKIAALRPEEPKEPAELAVPAWLDEDLRESLGEDRAHDFLRSRALPPPLSLRVHTDRDTLAEEIRQAHPRGAVVPASLSPLGLYVSRVGDPRRLPGYSEGALAVQDEGSQLVALLADVRPGMAVADVCSGRGGKTVLLASRLAGQGRLVAIDAYENKLDRIDAELGRLHIATEVETAAIDMSVGTGGLSAEFDRVLVDAPCTGLGTIHRRPEILTRITREDPARMAELQLAILRSASQLVRPGGLLTYAVCSPMRAEGPSVVLRFEAEQRGWRREVGDAVGLHVDPDGVIRIGPFGEARDAGPDAYQVVRWTRSE